LQKLPQKEEKGCRMKHIAIVSGAFFSLAAIVPAWAQATQTGRISYVDEKTRALLLDSHYVFNVAPNVDMSGLLLGQTVEVSAEQRGDQRVIVGVKPVTIAGPKGAPAAPLR